jgi:excisionase family DNA binding protein
MRNDAQTQTRIQQSERSAQKGVLKTTCTQNRTTERKKFMTNIAEKKLESGKAESVKGSHLTPALSPKGGEGNFPRGTQPEGYIKKAEVARRIGKGLRTVDYWMSKGLIPYIKVGRAVLFKWSDVERHLQQNFGVCPGDLQNSATK